MIAHVVVAYLHFIGIMILMATLLAEYVILQPDMPRLHMQRLAVIDLFYGIAAGIVLSTGLLRFAYFGKGMQFYLGNPLFYAKVGIFLLVALIAIYPTVTFLSWRNVLKQDQAPKVEPQSVTRLQYLVRLELGLLLVIPLLAVLMARGIGLTSMSKGDAVVSKADIDDGQAFDWGQTSKDYTVYRPGYPASFYTMLHALGIGRHGQDILDLGTGTGVLARAFAQQGAHVMGIDIADEQIVAARQLARQENVNAQFMTCAAEETEFPAHAFDVVSCGQSWLYFDTQAMIPLVTTWLKPGGKLVLTHLSWLPRTDRIAQASEQLILQYNPDWTDADFPGSRTLQHDWSAQDFRLVTYHAYEEGISFTRESWRGRIRASRGIGAALRSEDVERFDREHDALLRQIAPEAFTIVHQIWLHAYTPISRSAGAP